MDNLYLNMRINYRNIRLTQACHSERVGCLTRLGEVRYVPWLGFVARQEAKALHHVQPVRIIDITRFGIDTPNGTWWEELTTKSTVHGCLTEKGVYAVVDISIATIEKLKIVE